MFETIITCKCVSVLKDEMIFAVKKKKKKKQLQIQQKKHSVVSACKPAYNLQVSFAATLCMV